jgi:hypothetical protein
MKIYETYGTLLEITQAKEKVMYLCSLKFEERESSYHGVYYVSGDKYNGESYQIVNNIDLLDNEKLEDIEFPVILYINNITSNKNQMIKESRDFVLISREVV